MNSPKHMVEALLFSSGKTMSEETLVELTSLPKAKVSRALKALQEDYEKRDCAVMISNDEKGWKMGVINEYLPLVKNIVADTELSTAVMETLAIIAYQHPEVLQSEVVETRGSSAYEHIKELEDLGFIRKEPQGRSYSIKLTEKFFNYFDVQGDKDIKDLFKKVKVPKKVDVVEVEKKEGLDGMEVVDVSDEPEKPEILKEEERERAQAEQKKSESHKQESAAHMKFLDDLDKKIDMLTKKNDEHDEDPLLKREEDEETQDPNRDPDL